MSKKVKDIAIEGARIAFRNFSGEPGKYNAEGKRNFCVMLEPDLAAALHADGWNVKQLTPRDPDEAPQDYIQVAAEFNNYPPTVMLISPSKGQVNLDENGVGVLDWADIENVDTVIRPYAWEVNGKTGVKAYLKSIYVTIREDEFASKYSDTPDSAQESICVGDHCYPIGQQ